MTDGKQDKYAAVDASLGYLYQVRSALLWTLKRMKSEPDFLVGIETLDDVAFETVGGDPRELLQTKHHRSATASLTDASTDLWKTLRIWFEGTASGEIPATASMCLVTTGEASAGSAASCLHGNNRDVQAAVTRLNATAQSSTNVANKPAYAAYLAAAPTERAALLGRVTVLDVAPTVDDLDGELRREVFWAVDNGFRGQVLQSSIPDLHFDAWPDRSASSSPAGFTTSPPAGIGARRSSATMGTAQTGSLCWAGSASALTGAATRTAR